MSHSMRKLFIPFIVFTAFVSGIAIAQDKRDENEIVMVSTSDPDMVAATRHARSTLAEFLALSAKPAAGTSHFKLKVRVKDGADIENFWVTPFRPVGLGFEGTLANDPKIVRNVTAGQVLKFSQADITDWGYVRNGRQVGSFTVCVLFKKMPKEQADYYRKNHGFDC